MARFTGPSRSGCRDRSPASRRGCAHLPRLTIFVLMAALVGVTAAVFPPLAPGPSATSRSAAQEAEPFLQPYPVVVLADRLVCSLLGTSKSGAGVRRQDTGGTVEVDGALYWSFGDTQVDDGPFLPNTIGWSSDRDASDCLDLVPKTDEGRVAALLPKEPHEFSVWPSGMELTSPGRVHFFYTSVLPDQEFGWRAAGAGIASFDVETLAAKRELDGALLWPAGMPLPVRSYADETYVYVFLNTSRAVWTTDVILGRVRKEAIESPADYEYWDPEAGESGEWLGGLWDESAASWDAALADIAPLWRQPAVHNGIEVAYNEFLGRWLAVYSGAFLTRIHVRAADELTGPWDDVETVLVRCPEFHPTVEPEFSCYSGAQHEFYETDGGRTIFVSYSNPRAGQVFLHEIRLGAPVTQWTDAGGQSIYLPDGRAAPDGFLSQGLAFYASDIPVPGMAAVHRWQHLESGAIRYGIEPPDPATDYQDLGVDFYAPPDADAAAVTNAPYEPVYRWTRAGTERYSPLNSGPSGYEQREIAFYAACPDADGDRLTDCLESFLLTDPAAVDSDGDGTDDGDEDFDLDGCTNLQEVGSDPGAGGGRDPLTYWDFYDTPNADNERDGVVSIADLMRVARRFGRSGDVHGDPLAPPIPPAPEYHTSFDRGGQAGNAWSTTAADGAMTLGDILGVIAQYGHNCTQPGDIAS